MRSTPPYARDGAKSERAWTLGLGLIGVFLLALLLLDRIPPEDTRSHLQRIRETGLLRVATVNDPLTYLINDESPAGFEYDLATAFAEHLGVRLEVVVVPRFQGLFTALASGEADFAAATITVTEARRQQVRFGPSYRAVTQEVIYRAGRKRPRSLEDLAGMRIAVLKGTSYAEHLQALSRRIDGLAFEALEIGDIESLFESVTEDRLDVTIADSNVFEIHRRFYPSLKRAFSLTEPQPVAWAFPRSEDPSLAEAARGFFEADAVAEILEDLDHRYFGHVPGYNRINTHYFLRHIPTRLERLKSHFQQASRETGIDWKLLAAMGYQESLWNEDAVSATGVRGVMMLTRATARQMGVDDRTDPAQSILGGARYLQRVKRKIPQRIPEPDRTWLALAAYNVGFGHLEDARILTQRRGGDPDLWRDVAENLPLLSDREWYPGTRFGYARGREPVQYVRNVRSYYDILNWRLAREDESDSARLAP